jgi:hypothetical protein
MAYIGHRCDCGHSDLQHTGDGTGKLGACQASYGYSCGRGCGPTPEPEVISTFDSKGRPIERIIPPGDGLKSESGAPIVRTCPCDACTALHSELAGTPA